MDYSQLSDFEINRMVGDIIFKGLWACKPETSGNDTGKWYYGNADTTFVELKPLPNYCSKWAEAGPIIEENMISIGYDGIAWEAFSIKWDVRYCDWRNHPEHPLRIAMIVFLMGKEKEIADA